MMLSHVEMLYCHQLFFSVDPKTTSNSTVHLKTSSFSFVAVIAEGQLRLKSVNSPVDVTKYHTPNL